MSSIQYSGSFNVPKPRDEVTRFISDLGAVIKCIPNVVNYEVLSGSRARARFRVDLGDEVPIAELRRITSDVTIEVLEATNNGARLRINGRAAGSQIEANLSLTVEPEANGSRVNWSVSASLGRLLQLMSRFINVNSIIERIANDTVNGILRCMS